MAPQWTTNRQFTLPAQADGVTVTPSGTAWVPGAWVELGTIDTASVLTGITPWTSDDANLQFEVDIATGDETTKVVIDVFKGMTGGPSAAHTNDGAYMRRVIGIDNIAAGARLWASVCVSTTSVAAFVVAMTYLKKPITGNLLVSANPTRVAPSRANLIETGVSNSTAWTYGGYVEVLASTPAAIVLEGIIWHAGAPATELDLATGAIASEVFVHTFRSGGSSGQHCHRRAPLNCPFDGIGTGLRLSARERDAAGFHLSHFGIEYKEKPL